MSRAWMREPGPCFEDAIVGGPRLAVDVDKAVSQHRALQAAMAAMDLDVHVLPALDGSPDACFVEDRAVILGGEALMTVSAVAGRSGETESLAGVLGKELELVFMDEGTADGGDILQVGSWLFIGRSKRTNDRGCEAVSAFARRHGLRPLVVNVGELHLKCSASSPAAGVLVAAEHSPVLNAAPADLHRVIVPSSEAYAANTVGRQGTVLVAQGFPRTRELLDAHDLEVHLVDVSQFALRDGSITCLSLVSELH